MANRIKTFFESLIFAGLKPGGGAQAPRRGRLGPLREKIERFLSGGRAPSDPFYLSNRSWKQKLRLAVGIAVPGALLLGALALVFTNVYAPTAAPPKETPASEILAKLLPNLEKTIQLDKYPDAEFVELRVRRDGPRALVGVLRNKTDRVISVEFDADLADLNGARVGSITKRVEKAPAKGLISFEFPLDNADAAVVFIRRMRTAQ